MGKASPPVGGALRPRTIALVIGQGHLLGPGKPLGLALKCGSLHSMIRSSPAGLARRRWRG
jgi:putative ATPase